MSMNHSTRGLSDLAIKRMKKDQADLVDSGENAGLRVSKGKSGKTSFIYRYRSPIDNKIKQFKLGNYPEMSLAQARVKLEALKRDRSNGICPATLKRVEGRSIKQHLIEDKEKQLTVVDVVERYLSEYIEDRYDPSGHLLKAGARKLKGQREVRNLLLGSPSSLGRKDGKAKKPMFVELLGNDLICELTAKDVFNAVIEVVNRGAPVSAGNMLREFTAAVDYSIGDGLPEEFANPCYQAKSMLSRKKVKLTASKGKRILNDTELAKLLSWLPSSSYTPTQKSVLIFTLMTGCRTGEVVEAEWRDIDLERGIWALRENKTDMPRDVQLSTQAIALLTQLKRLTGEYVFPSQKTGKPIQQKSLSEQAWHLRRDGRMLDIAHWTPHDLRRSVRTGLARLGCPEAVSEAILGHEKMGVAGIYNLHSYAKESREWLQTWCDHLDILRGSHG